MQQSRYYWELSSIAQLKGYLDKTQDALKDALVDVTSLIDTMGPDATWEGEHKKMFLSWMTMMKDLHTQLASQEVSGDASEALRQFYDAMATFEGQAAMRSLGRIS